MYRLLADPSQADQTGLTSMMGGETTTHTRRLCLTYTRNLPRVRPELPPFTNYLAVQMAEPAGQETLHCAESHESSPSTCEQTHISHRLVAGRTLVVAGAVVTRGPVVVAGTVGGGSTAVIVAAVVVSLRAVVVAAVIVTALTVIVAAVVVWIVSMFDP
jgi:hypothetical protein